MAKKKLNLSKLVMDLAYYPRQIVDSSNVTSICDAITAGEAMPPIVACAKTLRIADGWHRITAYQKLYGPDAEAFVDLRDYADDRAFFLDCVRLNTGHGRRLSPLDCARCTTIGLELAITEEEMAQALRVTVGRLEDLKVRKIAFTPAAKPVPIKNTLGHLAGKEISPKQEDGNKKACGHAQLYMVNQVLNLFEYDLLDRSNVKLMAGLAKLHEVLSRELDYSPATQAVGF